MFEWAWERYMLKAEWKNFILLFWLTRRCEWNSFILSLWGQEEEEAKENGGRRRRRRGRKGEKKKKKTKKRRRMKRKEEEEEGERKKKYKRTDTEDERNRKWGIPQRPRSCIWIQSHLLWSPHRPVRLHVYTDLHVLLQSNTQLVSNSRKHRCFHVEHSPK